MVLQLIYECALLTWGACALPSMLRRAGSQKGWLLSQKLGNISFSLPASKRIWIHSVSLGETKAVEPLIKRIKQCYPGVSIVCSHATLTGYSQSSKNPLVDYSFILPLDLSFIMKRLVKKISPQLFILVESDYWPSLLHWLRKMAVPIAVVNGKLSTKTGDIYSRFPFLKKFTFEQCQQIQVQNEHYLDQFLNLKVSGPELMISGNIKFDIERKYLTDIELAAFAKEKGVPLGTPIITFGCTHEKEEEIVVDEVKLLLQTTGAHIIIAPRHLERVPELVKKLSSIQITAALFSQSSQDSRVLIIDQIGVLDKIYQLSTITLLCGSLVPGIGGHNLFEPLEAGTALLYGPFVHQQKEMDELITQYESGLKISLPHLHETALALLSSEEKRLSMVRNARVLLRDVKGSVEKTFRNIEKFIGD